MVCLNCNHVVNICVVVSVTTLVRTCGLCQLSDLSDDLAYNFFRDFCEF